MIERVEYSGSRGKLVALLQTPEHTEGQKLHLVIVLHGIGDHKDTPFIRSVGNILQKHGLACLRLDFNGHGDSEGSFTDMTVLNEVDDAEKSLEFAESLPFVQDVSFIGHSQGGLVAGLLAGKVKSRIKSLVLMASAAILKDGAINGNILGGIFDPNKVPDTLPISWGVLGKPYILTARELPVYEQTSQYKGPVCLIHGDEDPVVPYSYSDHYSQVMTDCEYHLLKGFRHSFEPNHRQAIEIAADFITRKVM